MRKIFILVLIALLAGVAVVALIETDPGYVLFYYGICNHSGVGIFAAL